MDENTQYDFTLFTGTYNSEKTIERVFRSIENQTYRNFKWIVIDDFSKDRTVQLINEFIKNHYSIDIELIIHKENKGIATRRKEAVERSSSKYFISWDHDDIQLENQLMTFKSIWDDNDNDKIACIFSKVQDQNGNILGSSFPEPVWISDYISAHNRFLIGSRDKGKIVEHHACIKTKKFKEILDYYKNNSGLLNNNLPNGGNVWGMLAYLGYKTIFINNVQRIYFVNEPGRISMSSSTRHKHSKLNYSSKLLWVNLFDTRLTKYYYWKVRNVFAVILYGKLSGYTFIKISKDIKSVQKKILALFLLLPSSLLANRYKP